MFKDIKDRIALKLLKATIWGSEVVALYYQPKESEDRNVT